MFEALESITSSDEIMTFENGKYTNDVRACVYELLSLNVGVDNISPIIKCVLNTLAHKSVKRLPSHALLCQMILESLTTVQAQLGEEIANGPHFSTLQTDGTTKFSQHYVTYDITTSQSNSSTYILGIRHVFSGSSGDKLETFKKILDDIDSVQLALGKDAVSKQIISKLKNTMSDRHAAEKIKFNEMLCEYRADILPIVMENWQQMTEIEKEQLMRMNNFFCGLHFLVGLANAAEETLKFWEKSLSKVVSATSGTQRLIRNTCKALHHRGSQQCGSSALFRTYLRKLNIKQIPLAQFVGNRFNILFYDAAGVYFLKEHIINFIKGSHGNEANRLLITILQDLEEKIYLAGCRALGLVDNIITGPLWRKLQDSQISILKMSTVYTSMKDNFDLWSEDANILFKEDYLPQDDLVRNNDDEIWRFLICSDDADIHSLTVEILQLLFASFSSTAQRLLLDHLPGGQYYDVISDPLLMAEASSVPTTNVAPERDFAILDRMIRQKPNAYVTTLESMILYSQNKTSSWLDRHSPEEKESLISAARALAPSIKAKCKQRQQDLEKKQEQALEKRQLNIVRKQQQTTKEKEKLTNLIQEVGLWSTISQVEDGLNSVSTRTAKIKLLNLQINFRNKVLGQSHHDKSLFKFSQNGRVLSMNQLKDNLIQLLTMEDSSNNNSSSTVGTSLELVIAEPQLLVGKKVKHRFDVEGELLWYNGTVLEFNHDDLEFKIVYDETDEIFYYNLLEDMENGDLIIIDNQ